MLSQRLFTIKTKTNTSIVVHPNLKAWYKFDGNVLDSTTNGRNGTVVGSPTYTNGMLNIDTNKGVDIGAIGINSNVVPFTLRFRGIINPSILPVGGYRTLICNGGGGSSHYGQWYTDLSIYRVSSTVCTFRLAVGQAQFADGYAYSENISSSTEKMYDIIATYDPTAPPTNCIAIYTDGVKSILYGSAVPTTTSCSSDSWRIGRGADNNYYLTAQIDEVQFFNKVLSSSDLALISAGQQPIGVY
jgi:hypothetical protein